jgi:hypothetical protein
MATESFGVSFGNPSRYMGSSPLGEIGKALKTGAMVYGMEKSGLIKYLDELGVKQKNGGFSFENKKDASIPGAVSPIDQVPQAGGPMTYGNQGAEAPIAGAVPPALTPTSELASPETAPVPMPRIRGVDLLEDKISVANPNDFDPRENYGYTEQLASGNEYTQQPGYGRTAGMMKSMFGLA